MTNRICPECGSDTWRSAGYDELLEARDRHWEKNREQAIEILRLQLRVAELEERERGRQRKVNRQRVVIRRLEERLRDMSTFPYEGFKPGETSPVPQDISPREPDPDAHLGPSPRGMRQLRRQKEAAARDATEEVSKSSG